MNRNFTFDFRSSLARTASVLAAAGMLVLSGCAGTSSEQQDSAASASPSSSSSATAQDPGPSESNDQTDKSGETNVEFRVTGDAASALVRNVVVLTDSDSNGDATKRDLPWGDTVTLTAAETAGFHKLVLFAKNVDGERGNISCEISVNGEVVATEQTTGYQPVTCLYLSK